MHVLTALWQRFVAAAGVFRRLSLKKSGISPVYSARAPSPRVSVFAALELPLRCPQCAVHRRVMKTHSAARSAAEHATAPF
jgi:hypothetical protein